MELLIYALEDNPMHYGGFTNLKEILIKKGEVLEAIIEEQGVFVKMPDNVYYLMSLEHLKTYYRTCPQRKNYGDNERKE